MDRRGWVVVAGVLLLSWGCGADVTPVEESLSPSDIATGAPPVLHVPPPPARVEELPGPWEPSSQPAGPSPGAPTRLSIQPGVGGVRVTWEPPLEEGGAPVEYYSVQVLFRARWPGTVPSAGMTQRLPASQRQAWLPALAHEDVQVRVAAQSARSEFAAALSPWVRVVEPIDVQASAESLPGDGCTAVSIRLHRREPVLARLVLEYQDPASGLYRPATLATGDAPVEQYALRHPRTAVLLWRHGSDLPGVTSNVRLRVRALLGDVELGSVTQSTFVGSDALFTRLPLEHGTGEWPAALRLGDFNGDGRTDLAVAHRESANIAVYLQAWTGGIPEHALQFTPVPAAAEHLVAGDFNGDGRLDLATGGQGAAQIFVLLGRGNGAFSPGRDVPLDGVLDGLELADVDGDGKGDLVALSGQVGRFQVARGLGDGTFGPARSFEALEGARWLGVGDFDGDRQVDVAFTPQQQQRGARLVFSRGRGDGSFQWAGEHVCDGLRALGTGDLKADGRAEVLFTCHEPSGSYEQKPIRAARLDGTGVARSREVFMTHEALYASATVGDVNGDARPDLLLVRQGTGGSGEGVLLVAHAQQDGSFAHRQSFGLEAPQQVVLGHLNNDQVIDAASAGAPTHHSVGQVELLFGKGDGSFASIQFRRVHRQVQDALPVDLNRDGRMDLVVAGDALSVRLGRGDGGFHPALDSWLLHPPRALAAADLDGDTYPELLVLDAEGAVQTFSYLHGFLAWRERIPQVPSAVDLQTADFNGDGRPDILLTLTDRLEPVVHMSNSQHRFDLTKLPSERFKQVDDTLVADVDGDGKLDVLLGSASNPTRLLRGNGHGGFTLAPVSIPGRVSHVRDFTGDGRPDLLTRTCAVLAGQPDGTFIQAPEYSAARCDWTTVADIDGDGRPEVLSLFSSAGSGDLSVWHVDATGSFLLQRRVASPLGGEHLTRVWTADFNGDGADDPVIYRYYQYERVVKSLLSIQLTGPCTACAAPSATDPAGVGR